MKVIILCFLLVLNFNAYAATAFFVRETTSGMNKICYYNHLGSEVAITISNIKLCPITIDWKD